MTATRPLARSTPWYREPWVALTAFATGWSGLLLVLAFVLPVESDDEGEPITGAPGWMSYPKRPLVHVNGAGVLWIVAIPLFTCLLVAGLLLIHRRLGWAPAWLSAVTLSGLLSLAGVLGTVTFLVGVFVIPSGGLLLCACLVGRSRRDRPPDLEVQLPVSL